MFIYKNIFRFLFVVSLTFFIMTLSASAGENVKLENKRMSLVFNGETGRLDTIHLDGKEVARSDTSRQWFDFRQENNWQYGKHILKLLEPVKKNEDTVTTTIGFGDWTFEFIYKIDPIEPACSITTKIGYSGEKETRIKGFWYTYPEPDYTAESLFLGPGNWPPEQNFLTNLKEGMKKSFGRATPSLIFERHPQLSFLYIIDDLCPIADSCSVFGEVLKERFRPGFNFNIQGRMKKGSVQEVGTAWFLLYNKNAENTLLQIHDWMKKVGHVVPKDRPKWFESASLYSFHPGGTIGSDCKDLGGFRNAIPLMDRVHDINLNAIWIMPIEDASIYSPRDYYKFQKGLGTGDDYHALVDKAHQIGLHVLQDIVPHGGRNTYPRAIEHPEWLVYDEQGETLSYWCFDFNWPSWRKYMEDVAHYYVKEYDIDGYRVDAVGGSKIENWNPNIPYGRASYAKRQGGLNMLRSLRKGVKDVKPQEGGLLAEVQGSVYGAVSDALYDFRVCYSAFHDVRRSSPDLFVKRIRRMLYEENYSEIKDLLRFRHTESHDSLRTMLWYGVEPARAVLALSTFIHGIPLVYHEQENGNIDSFRKIFGIKNTLPELQGGDADYLSVQVPDGVFAVRRSKGKNASVALINFNYDPIRFDLSVPDAPVVTDMMTGKIVSVKSGKINVALAPYAYNVYALREITEAAPTVSVPKTVRNVKQDNVSTDNAKQDKQPGSDTALVFKGDSWQATIDQTTGLILSYESNGQKILENAEIFLPTQLKNAAGKVEMNMSQRKGMPRSVTFKLPFGNSVLRLRYTENGKGLGIDAEWSGENPPKNAMMTFPVQDVLRWNATTAEGTLADKHLPRPDGGRAGTSSIYWRVQGTAVQYDSLLCPLDGTATGTPAIGIKSSGGNDCSFTFREIPARVQWLSKIGDDKRLTAAFSFGSPEVPFSVATKWSATLCPTAAPSRVASNEQTKSETVNNATAKVNQNRPYRFLPIAGGWLFENSYYKLLLYRNGSIRSLVLKEKEGGCTTETVVFERNEIYTDYGPGERGKNFSSINEVEVASRIGQEGKNIRLQFNGRLRGFGRFELLKPGVEYTAEYLLGESPTFEMAYGIKSLGKIAVVPSFIALRATIPNVDSWRFLTKGKTLAEGKNNEVKGRSWQSKGKASPDEIRLFQSGKQLVSLTGLQGNVPQNIFLDRTNFFFAFCDGEIHTLENEGSWSILCTMGNRKPDRISGRVNVGQRQMEVSESLLKNGDFEEYSEETLTALRSDQILTFPKDSTESWQLPSTSQIVRSETAPSGKFILQVENRSGEYILARQHVSLGKYPAGTKYKLSAKVKGENIVPGDISWKTGIVRWAYQPKSGSTAYVGTASLLGTFDWKKIEVEFTPPEGISSVNVELGLNGATGMIWFDHVTIDAVSP